MSVEIKNGFKLPDIIKKNKQEIVSIAITGLLIAALGAAIIAEEKYGPNTDTNAMTPEEIQTIVHGLPF